MKRAIPSSSASTSSCLKPDNPDWGIETICSGATLRRNWPRLKADNPDWGIETATRGMIERYEVGLMADNPDWGIETPYGLDATSYEC